jgi:hypothetical protein
MGWVALMAVGALLSACGSTSAPSADSIHRSGRTVTTGHPPGPNQLAARTPTTAAAAAEATEAYRADVDDDADSLVSAVARLQGDLVSGDTAAARSDELVAQSAYDGFRLLESDNAVISSALDERQSGVLPGQTFAGLHALERDLWLPTQAGAPRTSGDPSASLALVDGLAAQSAVAR